MQCTKCGKEMEKGIIQSNGSRIVWDTKKHHISVRASENGVDLAYDFSTTIIENAYCCKECRLISFKY